MEPLVFEPYLRPLVWGGRQLQELLGKRLPETGTFGESWEISGHSWHVSRVAEGPLGGTSLIDLWARHHQELVGEQQVAQGAFPLLIKYLDCRDLLSIQVHPSDELAPRLSREKSGKTEAWLVLDAGPTARIFAGLKPGVGQAEVERHLQAGTLDQCLHAFRPRRGDCIFLPAGIVHAVGGGVVLAEVQQSSDATFRLFDWNRLGSDGQPRPLHIRESLEAIDWQAGPVSPVVGQPLTNLPAGVQGECLVRGRYFVIERYQARQPLPLPHPRRLSIWLVLEGAAQLQSAGKGYRRSCRRGDTVLVPASAAALCWYPDAAVGPATLLRVTLPDKEEGLA